MCCDHTNNITTYKHMLTTQTQHSRSVRTHPRVSSQSWARWPGTPEEGFLLQHKPTRWPEGKRRGIHSELDGLGHLRKVLFLNISPPSRPDGKRGISHSEPDGLGHLKEVPFLNISLTSGSGCKWWDTLWVILSATTQSILQFSTPFC